MPGCARSLVLDHHAWHMLAHEIRVPHVLRRQRENLHGIDVVKFRMRIYPGEKRRPDFFHLGLIQPMAQHAQMKLASTEAHLLAPVRRSEEHTSELQSP